MPRKDKYLLTSYFDAFPFWHSERAFGEFLSTLTPNSAPVGIGTEILLNLFKSRITTASTDWTQHVLLCPKRNPNGYHSIMGGLLVLISQLS